MQVQGSRDTARDSGLRVQSQNSTFSCDLGIRRQEFAADRSSAAQLMTTMEHVRSVLNTLVGRLHFKHAAEGRPRCPHTVLVVPALHA